MSAHNEWDRLEEVIVGRADLACLPHYDDPAAYCCADVTDVAAFKKMLNIQADSTYGPERILAANRKLDELSAFLESGGITVRRPTPIPFNKECVTPNWSMNSSYNCCHPRDIFMIIGDLILETPTSSRERYFENWSYKAIMKDYFQRGARWIAAPKPEIPDELYSDDEAKYPMHITDFEPCFDAADFVRCGKDIVGHLSHVTNPSGVEWLRRTLGSDYNVHLVKSKNPHALHIDTTFMPLAPGRVLVNPDFMDMNSVPPELRHWELLVAPEAIPHSPSVRGFVSKWVAVNVVSLDEKRVMVDPIQKPLIKALKDWGFEPVPFDLSPVYAFGGGLHCVTLDIRRTKPGYGSGLYDARCTNRYGESMQRLSWEQVETAAAQLAEKIRASGFQPDCLIGITTGGLFPLAMLAKRLPDRAIYTVTTKRHWDDKRDWIDILYMPEIDLEGKAVLLVDEITHWHHYQDSRR